MKTEWIVIGVLALIGLYAIVVFNRLIRGRNLVREGFSGIDVQLKRRSDLIPNLVETVKAYAAHERGLFEEVAAKRTSAMNATDVAGKAAAEHHLQVRCAGCSPSPRPIRSSRPTRISSLCKTKSPNSRISCRWRGAITTVR